MSSRPPGQPAEAEPDEGSGRSILGLIETLERAARSDLEPEAFAEEVLKGFAAFSEAVYVAFWHVGETGPSVRAALAARVAEGDAAAWARQLGELAAAVTQRTVVSYRRLPEPSDMLLTGETYTALGLPVPGDDEMRGAITVVLQGDEAGLSQVGVALMRMLADYGLVYSASRAAARYQGRYRDLSAAWDVVGEALAFGSPQEMAHVLCDRARAVLDAVRVSVGLVKRGKVQVAAISGEDIVDRRSNTVRRIQAAQTDVFVSGEPGRYVASADAEERARQAARHPQQERLAAASEADAVYSVPLRAGDETVAVWTFEFGPETLDDRAERLIDVMAGQLGPALGLAREGARGPLARAGAALTAGARWAFGREHPWRKVAVMAAVAVVAFLAFGRVTFNVAGSCVLEPASRRVYTAPFRTAIAAAPVRPGDTVEAGQTVVEFDRSELELQLRETRSNLASVEKEMAGYLAGSYAEEAKAARYAEARWRAEALEAERELLERRLGMTTLRAAFPGIVLSGDLRHDIGRPVELGESLMEIAPLGQLLLAVAVAQGDVGYVEVGQEGSFTTKARPNVALPFSVTKVRPLPEVREGTSAYVAEALVQNDDGWLRPGMEGAAKVEIGRANAGWVAGRKLVNWVRLHLWW